METHSRVRWMEKGRYRTRHRDEEWGEEKARAEMEHGGGERRPKLLHLVFVNICKDLKCKDNRKGILKKERKNMTFKFT